MKRVKKFKDGDLVPDDAQYLCSKVIHKYQDDDSLVDEMYHYFLVNERETKEDRMKAMCTYNYKEVYELDIEKSKPTRNDGEFIVSEGVLSDKE